MANREVIREIVRKIYNGALFGIGFSIVFGATYYYIDYTMTKSMQENWDIKDKVVVKQSEEVKRGSDTLILGSLVNKSSQSFNGVSVQVDLLDKDGKFVDQCKEYIKGQIHPKEEVNFKVTCGCADKPEVEHASYKIKALGI